MDVMEEILTRLPVKHVLRCKLLSKSCYDLIKSTRFIKEHFLRHGQSDSSKIIVGTRKNSDDNGHSLIVATLSLSLSSCYELEETQVSIPRFNCNFFRIPVGSCNGLIVFMDDRSKNLNVYNPGTRKNMLVLKSPLEQKMWRPNHTSYYRRALGFAHDARSGDYKLVMILKYCNFFSGDCSILIQVWSMNTNSWTQINPPSTRLTLHLISGGEFYPRHGLLVNGMLYWLAHRQHNGQDEATIFSFDSTNNEFGEIAFPREDAQNYTRFDTKLIDYMGSLAFSFSRFENSFSQILFDIWVMGRDSVWTKRFLIGPFPTGVTTSQMCINGNFVLYKAEPILSQSMEDCEIILCDPHRNQVVMEATFKGLACTCLLLGV